MDNKIKKMKFCTNFVLPLVYDESLSYYEAIAKMAEKLNEVIKSINTGAEGQYILPVATETELGGVKAKAKTNENAEVAIGSDNKLYVKAIEEIPIADANTIGGVKPITKTTESKPVAVDSTGKLFTEGVKQANGYEIGGIIADARNTNDTVPVHIDNNTGKLYVPSPEEITPARNNTLGGIKADSKTSDDTVPVRIDTSTNKLYVAPSVEIAMASGNTLGGVKADEKELADTVPVRIDSNTGKLYTAPNSNIPLATENNIGGIKAEEKSDEDTTEVKIDSNSGRLYVKTVEEIPLATNETVGGIKAKSKTTETEEVAMGLDGKLYAPHNDIEQATPTSLGGVKAKYKTTENEEVAIDSGTGKLYVNKQTYSLPVASNVTLGGVKAKARTTEQNEVAVDTSTGKLYHGSTVGKASHEQLGGIMVSASGTNDETISTPIKYYPISDWEFIYGEKIPYSVDEIDGNFNAFNTRITLDLSGSVAYTSIQVQIALARARELSENIVIKATHGGTIYSFYYTNKSDEYDREIWSSLPFNSGEGIYFYQLVLDYAGVSPYYIVTLESLNGSGEYELPQATANVLGGVKVTNKDISDTQEVRIDPDTGRLYTQPGGGSYTLPQATANVLGGIKATNKDISDTQEVRIDPDTGKLYTQPGGGSYTLPQATGNVLGGVKASIKRAEDTVPVRINTSTGILYVQTYPEEHYKLVDASSFTSAIQLDNAVNNAYDYQGEQQFVKVKRNNNVYTVVSHTVGRSMRLIRMTGIYADEFDDGLNEISYEIVNIDYDNSPWWNAVNKSVEFTTV